jgi:hypothetical protein
MIHNATTKQGIIPRVGAQRRPEGGSQGQRGCVEPIIPSEVWCYDIISQHSLSRPQNYTIHSYWELGDVIGHEIQHFNKLMHNDITIQPSKRCPVTKASYSVKNELRILQKKPKNQLKIYVFSHTKRVVKVLHKSLSLPAAKRVVKVLHKSISRPFSQQVQKLMIFQL